MVSRAILGKIIEKLEIFGIYENCNDIMWYRIRSRNNRDF